MRYNKADFRSAAKAAQRASEDDGRLRFVQANANGYYITLRRIPWQRAWWTNGKDCGVWQPGASSGVVPSTKLYENWLINYRRYSREV